MSDKRLNIQLNLAFPTEDMGEALRADEEVTESLAANRPAESPGMGEQLMETVCEWSNIQQAVRRVQRNHGSAGVDGMTVHQLPAHLEQHWPTLRAHLLAGTYVPQPVKRVEIPKPAGGTRRLGIPTVVDRCDSASRPAECSKGSGIGPFRPTVMGFARGVPRIRRLSRRSAIWLPATTGWWT